MQIIFQVETPKKIKTSFFYERTNGLKELDEIDSELELFAERLSSLISQEPYKIQKYISASLNDFLSPEFISLKVINLKFICSSENEKNEPLNKVFQLTLHFDSYDKEYLDNLIPSQLTIEITEQLFNNLNTLTTAKD